MRHSGQNIPLVMGCGIETWPGRGVRGDKKLGGIKLCSLVAVFGSYRSWSTLFGADSRGHKRCLGPNPRAARSRAKVEKKGDGACCRYSLKQAAGTRVFHPLLFFMRTTTRILILIFTRRVPYVADSWEAGGAREAAREA